MRALIATWIAILGCTLSAAAQQLVPTLHTPNHRFSGGLGLVFAAQGQVPECQVGPYASPEASIEVGELWLGSATFTWFKQIGSVGCEPTVVVDGGHQRFTSGGHELESWVPRVAAGLARAFSAGPLRLQPGVAAGVFLEQAFGGEWHPWAGLNFRMALIDRLTLTARYGLNQIPVRHEFYHLNAQPGRDEPVDVREFREWVRLIEVSAGIRL